MNGDKLKLLISKMSTDDIATIFKEIHLKHVLKYEAEKLDSIFEKHRLWYEFVLKSQNYIFYIAKDEQENFISIVRLELEENHAYLSIFLKKEFRERGLSCVILNHVIEMLKKERKDIKYLLAYVLPENTISKKLFKKMHFEECGIENYEGLAHHLFEKKIGDDND